MPVCVDARLLGSPGTGVASYAAALVEGLAANGVTPLRLADASQGRFGLPESSVVRARRWLATRIDRPRRLRRDGAGGRLSARDVFRLAQVHFGTHGTLLRLCVAGPPGVMHWTYPLPLVLDGWVNVYTVHDAIPFDAPALSDVDGAALRRRLQRIVAAGGTLVTISDHARGRIAEALGMPRDAVIDCGNAPTALERAPGVIPAPPTAGAYLLYCGAVAPRKNLDRLIDAWEASATRLPLVIAGPVEAGGEAVHVRAAAHPQIVRIDYLPRPQLVALIADARALVFPSLAEGFGLPVIEAMALGTPVLTAARGALREVAGEAALLVDPEDLGAMAEAIARLAADDELCAALIAAGYARAADFTAARLGRRMLAAYDAAVAAAGAHPYPAATEGERRPA